MAIFVDDLEGLIKHQERFEKAVVGAISDLRKRVQELETSKRDMEKSMERRARLIKRAFRIDRTEVMKAYANSQPQDATKARTEAIEAIQKKGP